MENRLRCVGEIGRKPRLMHGILDVVVDPRVTILGKIDNQSVEDFWRNAAELGTELRKIETRQLRMFLVFGFDCVDGALMEFRPETYVCDDVATHHDLLRCNQLFDCRLDRSEEHTSELQSP